MRNYSRRVLWELNNLTGCWDWAGHIDKAGYGRSSRVEQGVEETYAHRWAWRHHRGAIPAGQHVLHQCDNPRCVNPDHLYLGTHDDNMHDKAKRNRVIALPGEANGNAKLTEAQVLAIREQHAHGRSLRLLASDFGVSKKLVLNIVHRRTWRHV